jgi:hypothetical protein
LKRRNVHARFKSVVGWGRAFKKLFGACFLVVHASKLAGPRPPSLFFMHDQNPVPWHFIGELFASGLSVEELAGRFHVPPKAIQRRLDVALSSSGYVRSNAEISLCSHKVKSDLISALTRFAGELNEKRDSPFDDKDLLRLERLTNIAAKLFTWPMAKAIDLSIQPSQPQNQAINLDLIKRNLDLITHPPPATLLDAPPPP